MTELNGDPLIKAVVLVVEDDPTLRELLCRALRRAHYGTVEASDGQEAYHLFQQDGPDAQRVDVMVSDHFMPGIDGFELALKLRAIRPDLPIVWITGEAPDSVLLSLAALHVSSVLFKPFRFKALREAISHVLYRPIESGFLEGRRSNRVDLMIQCQLKNGSQALLRNMSFGGCFLESSESFERGQIIQLRLPGPDRSLISAEVRWQNGQRIEEKSGAALTVTQGVGLCFLQSQIEGSFFRLVLNKLKQQGIGIRGVECGVPGSFETRAR